MSNTPNLGIPLQDAGSLQVDALFNELAGIVDVWLNCVVLAVGQAAPTGSEDDGDRYIVGTGTGVFAGHDDELAMLLSGTWKFYAPPAKGVPIIKNLDDGDDWERVGGVWQAKAGGGGGGGGGDAADVDYDNSVSGLAATNVQDAIDEVAAGGGGGGDFERIAQVIVTGSAVTDIDFGSLDLDADKSYELRAYIVPGATGAHVIGMYYNNDTTAANYSNQLLYGLSTSAGGAASSAATVHLTNAIPNTSNPFHFTADIYKATGQKPTCSSRGMGIHSGGEAFVAEYVHHWNNTTNVTAIKLRNAITNGFGVGSWVRLYRMN